MAIAARKAGLGFWLLWVLATGVGILVGMLAIGTVMTPRGVIEFPLLAAGIALGGAQWLVLRRYLARVGLWPFATLGGFLTGILLYDSVREVWPYRPWEHDTGVFAGYLAVLGGAIGAMIGVANDSVDSLPAIDEATP